MEIMIVGGTWSDKPNPDGSYGKRSGLVNTVFGVLKQRYNVFLANGGSYKQLEMLLQVTPNYDIVFWWPNVEDNSLPKIRDVKAIAPHVMLVTSKRNDEGNYSFMELTQHALARKANLTFEFRKEEGEDRSVYHVMVFDPLGCKWYGGADIAQAVDVAMDRLTYLRSITRQKTCRSATDKDLVLAWYFDQFKQDVHPSNRQVDTPDERKFVDLVRRCAEQFYVIMNPGVDIKRFLGNASMRPGTPCRFGRCSKGMPSFRAGKYMFISRRNVDKQFLDLEHFVPCYMEDGKLYYCGEDKPSVDAPIQMRLYQALPNIRYIIHSHCYLENAPFTAKSIPCGAIEEADEVLNLIRSHYGSQVKNFYALNLKGHGSLVMFSEITGEEDLKYIARPMPEDMYLENDKQPAKKTEIKPTKKNLSPSRLTHCRRLLEENVDLTGGQRDILIRLIDERLDSITTSNRLTEFHKWIAQGDMILTEVEKELEQLRSLTSSDGDTISKRAVLDILEQYRNRDPKSDAEDGANWALRKVEEAVNKLYTI